MIDFESSEVGQICFEILHFSLHRFMTFLISPFISSISYYYFSNNYYFSQ